MVPFLGEIKLFSFGFVPRGWTVCDGQLLSINTNEALFSLLGTTYGGNGTTTFALPDLRGRVPVHVGNGIGLGQKAGEEVHVLTVSEMPRHTHQVSGSLQTASMHEAEGNVWGVTMEDYYTSAIDTTMRSNALSTVGNSQAHSNMQPYNVANYCIAIQGIYPSRP